MLVIIAGFGTVGRFLMERFNDADADVVFIEESETKVAEIQKLDYEMLLIEGNMLSHYTLRRANVAACDFFIACSPSDSANIVACQLAKRLGAIHTIARVYSDLIFPYDVEQLENDLNLDWLLSPTKLTGHRLAIAFFSNPYVSLEGYFANRMEVAMLRVSEESFLHKKKISKIFDSEHINVSAVYREGKSLRIHEKLVLDTDDKVLVLGLQHKILYSLPKLYHAQFKRKRKIYFAGISRMVYSALSFMKGYEDHVVVLEDNLDTAKELQEHNSKISVLNVNPSEFQQLKNMKIDNTGTFVCSSDDDADNLTYAINADELGFKTILPLVHDKEKIRFYDKLNYRPSISPSALSAQEIFRYFNENLEKSFQLIEGSKLHARIKKIDSHSVSLGKTMDEIKNFQEGILPLALLRHGKIFLAQSKDIKKLEKGDRLLLSSIYSENEPNVKLF